MGRRTAAPRRGTRRVSGYLLSIRPRSLRFAKAARASGQADRIRITVGPGERKRPTWWRPAAPRLGHGEPQIGLADLGQLPPAAAQCQQEPARRLRSSPALIAGGRDPELVNGCLGVGYSCPAPYSPWPQAKLQVGAPGRIRTRDPLLRRCHTDVRCGLLPAEIACSCLVEGHGVRPRWCRPWVSSRPRCELLVPSH